jgi:prepilin-type N-terminal cleavage/methylation domain-containing protein
MIKFSKSKFKKNQQSGFTFVETLVAVAVSAVMLMATYSAIQSLFNIVSSSRAKIDAVDLVNEQIEIIRNMPYSEVGIAQGIPSGVLSHVQNLTRDGFNFTVTTFVRNIDDPFDGTIGGTPSDTSPQDYKSIEVDLACSNCKNFTPVKITTTVAPKNLETASTNGALFVKAFDASGNPVVEANVHIENDNVSPNIIVDDVTNNQGLLEVVDVPPANSAYQITVSKVGYSTDKTYLASSTNPHPTVPSATVVLQSITQASFSIDKLGSFSVSSVLNSCAPAPNFHFSLTGAKNIGTNPVVPKYSQNLTTDSGGLLTVSNMEWDSYTFSSSTEAVYDLVGITPLSPVSLAPAGSQNVTLVVAPKNPNTLLVTVRDKTTLLPLSVASVELTNAKSGYDNVQMTGQGFLRQTDWSGGSGQATSTTNSNQYFSSDGNVDVTTQAGSVTLKKILGKYATSGTLMSSSFDIGFVGTFQQILWNPGSEPSGTSVQMQIATNNNGGTWNFVGPDGTSATYYTTSNQNIFTTGTARYLRYKLFLSTTNTSVTPNVSDTSFTFTSSCTPPGQVSFSGLASGNYNVTITKAGYVTQIVPINISSGWQSVDVSMQGN